MSLRVLLVDDHQIVLDGLRAALEKHQDLEIIGELKDGREAVATAGAKAPNVVVMDISMPGLNGIEAARQITAEKTGVKVLCLSMHSEKRFVAAAFDAGASGFLLKDRAMQELVRAIRTVAAGRAYLCPEVAGTVLEGFKSGRSEAEPSAFSLLTGREREVLQLIAEGRSTAEIAEQLHVSTKTVATHREHIMTKVNINSVAGLTKYAIREGLSSLES